MIEMRVCELPECPNEFVADPPEKRFCCDAHRAQKWKRDKAYGRTPAEAARNGGNGAQVVTVLPHREADEPQADYVYRCLKLRGPAGVHTFELRRRFIGNPSQRIADLENQGYRIKHGEREQLNGQAYGTRYWLAEYVEEMAA